MMTLLDEQPSGKLCVSYQKQPVVDAVDEIKATTQQIPNLDIAKAKLICLSSVYCNGRSELIGYNLTCQLITLHDGTAYNSAEIVWNSEPRNIVCMTPYMLAFTANTLEIRMASNGSLIQTINIPDLHLISCKDDLYFTSTSLFHNYKGDSRIITPDVKIPKNIDKRGFLGSARLSEPDLPQVVYVYKIGADSLVGRRDSNASSMSIQSSDEVFTRSLASDVAEDSHSDTSLDHVHPVLEETKVSTSVISFSDVSSPNGSSSKGNSSGSGSGGDGKRKVTSQRKMLVISSADTLVEPEAETASVLSMNEQSHVSILETVSLESSVCSSPDSRVQDDLANSTPQPMGGRTSANLPHTCLHSQCSPSLLRSEHS